MASAPQRTEQDLRKEARDKLPLRCEVDSTSSSPYFSGPIEFVVEHDRMLIRWAGAEEWKEIQYHEILAWVAGRENDGLSDLLKWLKFRSL